MLGILYQVAHFSMTERTVRTMSVVETIERRMSRRTQATGAQSVLAVARIRVSTQEQARDDRLSLPVQKRIIEAWAEDNGREIVNWFRHEGESAYRMDPRVWEEELGFIRTYRRPDGRRIQEYLVLRQDRFSRRKYESATVKGELQRMGVSVVFVDCPLDLSTPEGVILESFLEAEAQVSSMRTGRNTRQGMAQNVETRDPNAGWCYKNGMRVPFGYAAVPVERGEGRHGVPIIKVIWGLDEVEVCGRPVWQWVHHVIAELRGEKGLGFETIARFLNGVGLPTPSQWQDVKQGKLSVKELMTLISSHGPEWSEHHVRSLCAFDRVRIYAGEYLFDRTGRGLSSQVDKPPTEWLSVKDAHPPILSQQEMEAVLLTNEERRNRWTTFHPAEVDRRSVYLLSGGPFRCGRCGRRMIGKKRIDARYYVCSSVKIPGGACGPVEGVRKEALEILVTDFILEQQWTPEFTRLVQRQLAKLNTAKANRSRDSTVKELARLKRQKSRLVDSIKKGVSPSALADEINDLQRQIESRERELQSRSVTTSPPSTPSAWAREFPRKFAHAPLHLQREYVRTFLKDMVVDPDTGEIRVNYFAERGLEYPDELKSPQMGSCSPTGTRTPVSWLRTMRPRPLDDRAVSVG
jgi:DNA invertase Pin-like site-specific DNA recombinase